MEKDEINQIKYTINRNIKDYNNKNFRIFKIIGFDDNNWQIELEDLFIKQKIKAEYVSNDGDLDPTSWNIPLVERNHNNYNKDDIVIAINILGIWYVLGKIINKF